MKWVSDISTNYLISYFHFEQSLFWRLVIILATPLPLLCIPGVCFFFKPELSHIPLGKSLSSAYDCWEFLNFLIWVLFVHHLAAFPWKVSNFFCLFFKGYQVAPCIFWVLVGHTKPNINLESVFLLPRSLVSKWSEGMPLSACPMDGEDFQAPGLVNTEPLANTKLQKDDDKQTSCQSSLSADRFSLSPPSSSLVLLCFRAKIPKYLRKKGLLGRIDPLHLSLPQQKSQKWAENRTCVKTVQEQQGATVAGSDKLQPKPAAQWIWPKFDFNSRNTVLLMCQLCVVWSTPRQI